MSTILLVEDEKRIREFLKVYFDANQYQVIEAENGQEALALFDTHHIDLILLDVMMPKLDGYEVCRKIRKRSEVPIIMVTAFKEEQHHLQGYKAGADDYISKPVKINILLAKIKRLLERSHHGHYLTFEGVTIDKGSRSIAIDQSDVEFTPKEFELLLFLAENNGMVFTRNLLIDRVWGGMFDGGTRVVDNHVKKIRKKLGQYAWMIKTVVSVGYKFEVK